MVEMVEVMEVEVVEELMSGVDAATTGLHPPLLRI